MEQNLRNAAIVALLVVSLSSLALASPPVTGAIFTTDVNGSIVNANTQYATKCDVYLNGGPGKHAPAGAAGLPSGDYYFQVTDPNGHTLLSTDVVANRRFHVSTSGVIDAYTGTGGPPHPTGIDQDEASLGAITIRLANTTCPSDYLDTPNNGGVYKVWVTPVTDFVGDPNSVDNTCSSGCYHGFVPSKTKTDNFKVTPTTATFCLKVVKQMVAADGTVSPGLHWPIQVTDSFGVTNNFFTNDTDGSVTVCGLVAGTYTVAEIVQPGTNVVGLQVNGVTLPAQSVYSFLWTFKSPDPFVVLFQNNGAIITIG
ncbi:MAG TPA: hypothetical protein VGZ73_19275 [Bryobacteraceae bacterium]|jgi:hypothetical protein|nr:hypothetical protein [Bryobacteraceae bacterium]